MLFQSANVPVVRVVSFHWLKLGFYMNLFSLAEVTWGYIFPYKAKDLLPLACTLSQIGQNSFNTLFPRAFLEADK